MGSASEVDTQLEPNDTVSKAQHLGMQRCQRDAECERADFHSATRHIGDRDEGLLDDLDSDWQIMAVSDSGCRYGALITPGREMQIHDKPIELDASAARRSGLSGEMNRSLMQPPGNR